MTRQKFNLSKMFLIFVSSSLFLVNQQLIPLAASALSSSSHKGIPHFDRRDLQSKAQDSGKLTIIDKSGKAKRVCPLKHTDVQASVSAQISQVSVCQKFYNPNRRAVEAVYTFPLPVNASVNRLKMKVGDRTIVGKVRSRSDAKQLYSQAKAQGKVASLLEQERQNIFTQSVANIPPQSTVEITISYSQQLKYRNGRYVFVFPMVVGPRYIPGHKLNRSGTGWSLDSDRVKDASRITPPVARESRRAGHDISLSVNIKSPVPVLAIQSKLHKISKSFRGSRNVLVKLDSSDSIPNRDFVLEWKVSKDSILPGLLTNKIGDRGYFSFSILPPALPSKQQINPREVIFVIDKSGSQQGLPLMKAKETVLYCLDRLSENDTFQILTFSNSYEMLFAKPVSANYQSLSTAKKYVSQITAGGGTEMREAILKVTKIKAPANRLRIIALMTDGYIGNEKEIFRLVKQTSSKARWFPFGTGNSVNRLLIEEIAKYGGGIPQYVLLNRSGANVAREFNELISSPVLTDVKVSISGIKCLEIYPQKLNDVWKDRPVYLTGRYTKGGKGTIKITGLNAGRNFSWSKEFQFPTYSSGNSMLASLWARQKVNWLTEQQILDPSNSSIEAKIEELGLNYNLLTPYTSLIAIDQSGKRYKSSGQTMVVPVEAPDGTIQKQGLRSRAKRRVVRHSIRQSSRAKARSYHNNMYARPYYKSYSSGSSAQGARFSYMPNRYRKDNHPVRHYAPRHRSVSGSLSSSSFRLHKFASKDQGEDPSSKLFHPESWELKLSTVLKRTYDSSSAVDRSNILEIKLSLSTVTQDLLKQLKLMGGEIVSTDKFQKTVLMKVTLGKLPEIAKLKEVLKLELSS